MKIDMKNKYILQTVCLILGFTISLIMLFYMTNYYLYEYSINEDRNEYSLEYSKDIICSVDSEKSIFDLLKLSIDDVKISIKDVSLYVDELGVTQMNVEILICNNTDFAYPLKNKKDDHGILLGRSYKRYIKEKNSIKIGGDIYKIDDFVSSDKSALFDYAIVIDANEIGKKTLRSITLQRDNLDILIESDKLSGEQIASDIYPLLNEIGVEIEMENFLDEEYGEFFNFDSMLIIVYSFLMIFLVMFFWTNNRMYEFAVRKAFGENSLHITSSILSGMTRLFFVSVFLSIILIVLSSLLSGEPLKNNDSIPMTLMVWVIDYILCMLIAMINPIVKLMRFNPSEILVRHKEV